MFMNDKFAQKLIEREVKEYGELNKILHDKGHKNIKMEIVKDFRK
ncbi:hypothetical protein [Zhaonella formicivorans]|nr:hypothetical protein [Zhaonella formicivorans]